MFFDLETNELFVKLGKGFFIVILLVLLSFALRGKGDG